MTEFFQSALGTGWGWFVAAATVEREVAEALGIEVYGLGIQLPAVRNVFPQHQVIQNLSELAPSMLGLIGQRLIDLSMSAGALPDQISQAQAMVMDLNAEDEQPDVITMKQALGPVFEDMQDRLDGKQVIGQDFGLTELDKIVRCIRPGNLVIIAGRPGTGKTVLGTNLADRIAIRKKGSALIFSLEMPNKELAKRSLSAESGVHQDWIETGKAILDEDACARITTAVAKLHAADIRICDKGALTFSRICSIARFEHRARKLDVIVIDYLSLIATDPNAKVQNRNLELGSYTRGFKALAKQLGIPVVVLAQLNRGIENRTVPKPKMSDLRDSGEIEAIVDEVIAANPGPVADYKTGKASALNFLKGQVMKLSKGKANPALAGEILEKKLV